MTSRNRIARRAATFVVLVVAAGLAWPAGVTGAGQIERRPSPTHNDDFEPSGSVPDAWGWAVNRRPTVSHTPTPRDMGNSEGQSVRIKRYSTGYYRVTFKGIDNDQGGNGYVTPLTDAPRACQVIENAHQFPQVNDISIEVSCTTRAGVLADTMFSANFLAAGDGGGNATIGYAWSNEAAPKKSPYVPDPNYAWNSAGSPSNVGIYHNGTGHYTVGFIGLGRPGGNAQVVATDAGARCKVVEWRSSGGDEYIDVDCRSLAGDFMNARFYVVFAVSAGLTGVAPRQAAYLVADQPTMESYQPDDWFIEDGPLPPTIKRTGVGTYRVTLPTMPRGGSAQVTAVGPGRPFCVLTSIRTDGTPQRIGVQCFRPNGTPVDSVFSLTYTK